MKLVTYRDHDGQKLGLMHGLDRVIDLDLAAWKLHGRHVPEFSTMLSLIEGGDGALQQVRDILDAVDDSFVVPLDSVTLLAPLPRPVQMRDFANYERHVRQALQTSMRMRAAREQDPEAARARLAASGAYDIPAIWYEMPLYYKCNRMSVVGPNADVIWPHYADVLDYELELGAVIGKVTTDATEQSAKTAIFGYTIYNDFSARDMQVKESQFRMGPAKGKDFDSGNAIGPWIVTADELPDPYDLEMIVRVNGEERGRGRSGDMQHSFERCIQHVSMAETLYPGEILMAGTVGNGSGFEIERFLEPGDVVELEVEKIGILRNRVVKT